MMLGFSALAKQVAPAFELPDVGGAMHILAQYAGKIAVLEWTNYNGPFVMKFYDVGAMQAMQEKYTGRNSSAYRVRWICLIGPVHGRSPLLGHPRWRAKAMALVTALMCESER